MRKLKAMDSILSRAGRYQEVKENLRVKEVRYQGHRYIVCLNPEEALHDRKAREAILENLQQKLKEGLKGLVGNKGYRRYLKVEGATASIDEAAITREAKYDGKYVLRTNTELPTAEVALAYKELWRVERAFREMKSGLDLRPIYHWTDSRARGHVMVCFLAFVMESALRRKLAAVNCETPYHELIQDLRQLHAVEVTIKEQTHVVRTELQGESYQLFKALGIRPPGRVIAVP